MKIKFNEEVLNVMHAVKDYKRFIISNNYIIKDKNFDWYTQTEKYYNSLPLPTGLNTSTACFNAVLHYPKEVLKEIDSTTFENLHNFEFGY